MHPLSSHAREFQTASSFAADGGWRLTCTPTRHTPWVGWEEEQMGGGELRVGCARRRGGGGPS